MNESLSMGTLHGASVEPHHPTIWCHPYNKYRRNIPMSHHFLYHYNAYHIVIVKPSLPRFYLCNIQKISAQFARYLPKLPSTTAKAARSLVPFPLPHPENDKTIAPSPLPLSYPKLYRAIFSLSRQITEHDSKGQCVPRRGGGGVEWCGDPWVALVPFPYRIPGMIKPSFKYFTSTIFKN